MINGLRAYLTMVLFSVTIFSMGQRVHVEMKNENGLAEERKLKTLLVSGTSTFKTYSSKKGIAAFEKIPSGFYTLYIILNEEINDTLFEKPGIFVKTDTLIQILLPRGSYFLDQVEIIDAGSVYSPGILLWV